MKNKQILGYNMEILAFVTILLKEVKILTH